MLPFAVPAAGERPAGATISPCGLYRYDLRRIWGGPGLKVVNFVMLNPSTADESEDDPTIRRCIAYAKAWGFGGLSVTNLYAFRATDPGSLWSAPDPVGPLNDEFIRRWASTADLVLMAWGNHGVRGGRGNAVMKLLKPLSGRSCYLKITGNGQPGHPLYLPSRLAPKSMEGLP
jgi:hypothetical protein